MESILDDPLNWSGEEQERALRAIAPWYDLDFGPIVDDVRMHSEIVSDRERVLEMGAGSGRIAVPLAQSGCRVTAVDSSEAMLQVGSARMEAAGVDVVRSDMRCLSLGSRFDLVIFGLSTFQHLLRRSDQIAALNSAARHLADSGRVIIDWTAPRPDDIGPGPSSMQMEWVRESDDGAIVTKNAAQEMAIERHCGSELDRALAIAWITYQYDAVGASGALRRSLARFPLRVNLTAGEMAGLLAEAGLRPVRWFGSWGFDEVGDGDRLIVLAESAA